MRIIFAGTPDFSVSTLQMLLASEHTICAVYTQPDRAAGRGRKLQASAVKQVAVAAKIAVLQPQDFKADSDVAVLKAFAADLMIVVAYGVLLPQVILDIPYLGCINIHASLLPRWRGAAPIQRALMAGDDKTGVTLMKMVLQLDAGDILHKEICTIETEETARQLHDKLALLGAQGLKTLLPAIAAKKLTPLKQDQNLVTYAQKLIKSEATLDWTQTAKQLALTVRGLNSWPVAQTRYQDKVLRIWQAVALTTASNVQPGVIVYTDNRYMDVGTGQGLLRLKEVQLPGGNPMQTDVFLNAHNIGGVKLGCDN